jgi:hypothetical protein
MRQSDFIQFLVGHGLAAADGTRTINQLAQQYGVRRWFEFIDVVYLPPSPLFSENREPYYVRCHTPTVLVPPAEFCCDFDCTGDGFRNHQVALARFSDLFGTPEKGIAVNTWSHTWRFGRASLNLSTFIREKTTGESPLYKKYPELWEKCQIWIRVDPVRPVSIEEETYLRSIPSEDQLPFPRQSEWDLSTGFPAWRRGNLPTNRFVCWRDRRGGKLGWYLETAAAFWEARFCTALKLVRLLPGRGNGRSTIYLVMRNPFSLQQEEVAEAFLFGNEPNSLDSAAKRLAEFWDLPLRTEEYPDE